MKVFFLYLKEKITLGISLLLSLVVFLTMIVKKFLPPTSLAFPLIAKYLVFTFVMNLSSMATSVYVINVNHRETCHMPNTLKWIFLFALPWLLFMDRTRKHRYDYSNKKINQPFTKLLVILYLNFTLEKHVSMECIIHSELIKCTDKSTNLVFRIRMMKFWLLRLLPNVGSTIQTVCTKMHILTSYSGQTTASLNLKCFVQTRLYSLSSFSHLMPKKTMIKMR